MLNVNAFNNWFNQNYEVNNNNKIKVKGKNRYLSESDVYYEYHKVVSMACLPLTFTEQDVVNELRVKYKVQTATTNKDSCRDWILSKLKRK